VRPFLLRVARQVNRNAYLDVWDPGAVRAGGKVNQTQYADIVMQQLTELWSQYGDLAEIWFDGGYGTGLGLEGILPLAHKLQPHAVALNGCGMG